MIDGMTSAPANLLAARRLLLDHLDDAPGSNDLEPGEVGIVVADPDHRGGYHCGADRVVSNDYSVYESSRDKAGLSDYACALDVGTFSVTTAKGTFDLPHYSRWLVAQCIAGTPDTRDLREVIYSPDGKVVRRWDRLGRRSSGDSSHLYHTHKSYFRDAIKAGRDQTPVIRRYLTHIGLLEADDMTPDECRTVVRQELGPVIAAFAKLDGRNPLGQVYTRLGMGEDHLLTSQGTEYKPAHPSLRDLGSKLDALLSASTAEIQRDAEFRTMLGKVQSGGMTPAEFVDEVGRRLAPATTEQ